MLRAHKINEESGPIKMLPDELMMIVLKYCRPLELLTVSLVCVDWNRLANHGSLWRSNAIRDRYSIDAISSSNEKRNYFEQRNKQLTIFAVHTAGYYQEVHSVEVKPLNTIGDLKAVILGSFASNVNHLSLSYAGESLSDDSLSIRDAGLRDNHSVIVRARSY